MVLFLVLATGCVDSGGVHLLAGDGRMESDAIGVKLVGGEWELADLGGRDLVLSGAIVHVRDAEVILDVVTLEDSTLVVQESTVGARAVKADASSRVFLRNSTLQGFCDGCGRTPPHVFGGSWYSQDGHITAASAGFELAEGRLSLDVPSDFLFGQFEIAMRDGTAIALKGGAPTVRIADDDARIAIEGTATVQGRPSVTTIEGSGIVVADGGAFAIAPGIRVTYCVEILGIACPGEDTLVLKPAGHACEVPPVPLGQRRLHRELGGAGREVPYAGDPAEVRQIRVVGRASEGAAVQVLTESEPNGPEYHQSSGFHAVRLLESVCGPGGEVPVPESLVQFTFADGTYGCVVVPSGATSVPSPARTPIQSPAACMRP